MFCSTCCDDCHFEQPPCPDGHGADCPERVCAGCGTAVITGLPLSEPALEKRPITLPSRAA